MWECGNRKVNQNSLELLRDAVSLSDKWYSISKPPSRSRVVGVGHFPDILCKRFGSFERNKQYLKATIYIENSRVTLRPFGVH